MLIYSGSVGEATVQSGLALLLWQSVSLSHDKSDLLVSNILYPDKLPSVALPVRDKSIGAVHDGGRVGRPIK